MQNKVSMPFVCRTLLYSLTFLTPFIFVQNTNELFEFPKMYFVYFVGSLIVIVTTLGRIWKIEPHGDNSSPYNVLSKPFLIIAGAFVASFILSTIFSIHIYTSIWGYFSRFNGGLISVLIFFGIFLSTLYIKPPIQKLLKVVSFTIIPISFYAIMQHFGLGGSWATDTTVRAFSTFGQPNWYGAYCAMVLPVIFCLALENNNQLNNGKLSPTTRAIKHRYSFEINKMGWWLLLVLGFAGFWFSYSVSGIIGLTISTSLVVLLNMKSVKNNVVSILITVAICLLVASLTPGIFKHKLDDALTDMFSRNSGTINAPQNQLTIAPVQNDINPEVSSNKNYQKESKANKTNNHPIKEIPTYNLTDSGFIRKGIWQGAINLWLASPKNILIGTGSETFPYEFQKFRPASLNYSSEWNFIINKPHNYYLELLAQNGIIGLLIYLAIIVRVILAKHPVLTPALVGLFVTNIFGWPTVSTTLLFWLFLALLESNRDCNKEADWQTKNLGGTIEESLINHLPIVAKTIRSFSTAHFPQVLLPIFCTTILLLSYSYLNIQFFRQYLADVSSKASEKHFEQGNIQEALSLTNRSIYLNPYEPFYYRQRAKTYMITTVGQSADQVAYIKALALKDMVTAQELNPQNLATLRGEIPLYYFLTLTDLSATAKELPQTNQFDSFYLELAKNYYTKLAESYPTDAGIQTQVAKYQKLLELTEDYRNAMEKIRILRPDLLDWYLE